MVAFIGQGLSCYRGGRLVFTGLDFRLDDGGALVLRGPNGSGKSTLLRLMAGLLRPLEGRLSWSDGEADIDEDPETHHKRTQFVGHADAVKPVLTVAENIAFWARLRTTEPNVDAALTALGIDGLSDVPGQFLSAGQKRRVNLARILAAPSRLWLLDEPATALDVGAIDALRGAIAQHRAGGGLVIASTHQDLGLDNADVLHLDQFEPTEPAIA